MGAFHAGHLSLMDFARTGADRVLVSLFVNPTQFDPGEDLARYPRDFERDRALAGERGVDVLFAPEAHAMYEPDHACFVDVPELARGLCGRSRPGHFRGVATVVAKLFHLAQPTLAVFGEKDWQQLTIIRRMVRDLNMPVRVAGRPTVREPDGLAMSSRNANLSEAERAAAPAIFAGLTQARQRAADGERDAAALAGRLADFYAARLPGAGIDYVEIVDPTRLAPVPRIEAPALLAVAVRMSGARLIDNILLGA
jgi:pantoate--beta-alanine ligase